MTRPWTEAHQREALRRTYEIAAEIACVHTGRAMALAGEPLSDLLNTEEVWARALTELGELGPHRVKRELRRVRALAEGRLVRETVWRVGYVTRPEAQARAISREQGVPLVRVTRLRRPR